MADSKRNDFVVRPSSEIAGTERRTPRVIEYLVKTLRDSAGLFTLTGRKSC